MSVRTRTEQVQHPARHGGKIFGRHDSVDDPFVHEVLSDLDPCRERGAVQRLEVCTRLLVPRQRRRTLDAAPTCVYRGCGDPRN